MKYRVIIAGLFATAAATAIVWATSTIDPSKPTSGNPYASSPIRDNFQAAINDINALQQKLAPAIAPLAHDLRGILPNAFVQGIQGHPVASTTPAVGQVYAWDGGTFTPARETPTGDGTYTCATVTITNGVPSFAAGTCSGGGAAVSAAMGTHVALGSGTGRALGVR